MASTPYAAEPFVWQPRYPSDSKLEQEHHFTGSSSPLSPESLAPARGASPLHDPTPYHVKLKAKLLMILPLALHCLGSIAIAVTFLVGLDGAQFYTEHRPQVKLANGTVEHDILGQYNLTQSDITTLVSVSVMVLRWVAAAWTGALCWHAIFLLGETSGLRRRDIKWAANYGILPPGGLYWIPLHLVTAVILLLTLAPHPASPLLTGSIAWFPNATALELPYNATIAVTGLSLGYSSPGEMKTSSMPVRWFTYLDKAWSQEPEEYVYKRVVPSAARLNTSSTIDNILVPYISIKEIKWLPEQVYEEKKRLFWAALNESDTKGESYFSLRLQLQQPQAVTLIPEEKKYWEPNGSKAWLLLLNVANSLSPARTDCNSSNTVLPNDTDIPHYHIGFPFRMDPNAVVQGGCFAFARVTFEPRVGWCKNCLISSPTTVQNDTALQLVDQSDDTSLSSVLQQMVHAAPAFAPITSSFPDPKKDLDTYVRAFLTRLYCTTWNAWADMYDITAFLDGPMVSGYKPAVSTLQAMVNKPRVYAWLALQLLATLAGIVFLFLHSATQHPLLTKTNMVAFDLDTTEVPKRDPTSKKQPEDMLLIRPEGNGWKVVLK